MDGKLGGSWALEGRPWQGEAFTARACSAGKPVDKGERLAMGKSIDDWDVEAWGERCWLGDWLSRQINRGSSHANVEHVFGGLSRSHLDGLHAEVWVLVARKRVKAYQIAEPRPRATDHAARED